MNHPRRKQRVPVTLVDILIAPRGEEFTHRDLISLRIILANSLAVKLLAEPPFKQSSLWAMK